MTFCAEPGCSAIVASGRCGVHARAAERARGLAHTRGYTRQWCTRARAFRAKYPLCGMRPADQAPVMSACADARRPTLADCVDHVVPHRGDPRRFWDEVGNWQSLCAACHAKKTAAGL